MFLMMVGVVEDWYCDLVCDVFWFGCIFMEKWVFIVLCVKCIGKCSLIMLILWEGCFKMYKILLDYVLLFWLMWSDLLMGVLVFDILICI